MAPQGDLDVPEVPAGLQVVFGKIDDQELLLSVASDRLPVSTCCSESRPYPMAELICAVETPGQWPAASLN